ncbi:MAG: ABC transporter ATP-binding protein [Planctomycetota bacterium]|nr:ABC transporter ATP-binding protein [Planctomycetota bacterium]
MSDSTVIHVKDLAFSYPGRLALAGVSFDVSRGEIFGIVGPNGGGKTTIFRVLSTLLRPDAGHASVCGHDVATDPIAIRRRIGVVFQSPGLDRKLTVRENLRHQGHLYGYRGEILRVRIDELLQRIGPADRADDRVETLSGGLQRRVEVAKGILHEPDVLLLDEPTSHLDPGARREVWDILRELQIKRGVTILLTTHLMEEAERCDRVAILDEGFVIASGTPESLKSALGGDVIRLEAKEPGALCMDIEEKFGYETKLVNGTIRIEREGGQAHAAALLEAFPGRIHSLTLGPPTLEDVFFHETGHRFLDEPTPSGENGR